jgi:hypothetical protein
MMQRQIVLRRALGTAAPAAPKKDGPKGPLDRLLDYFTFRPGATGWVNSAKHAAAGEGYRVPSPASRKPVNIPVVESEEYFYNTQYYTRDTARNQELPKLLSSDPPKEFPVEAPPEVSSSIGS